MALLFISQFAKLHFGMVDVQKVYLPKFVLNNVGLLQKPARFRYIMLLTLDLASFIFKRKLYMGNWN